MPYDWSSKIREMEDGLKLPFDVMFGIPGLGIILGSQTDGVVEAHKAFLAAVSPVFQAMLSENWNGGQTDNHEIRQICPEAFQTLISFIYNNSMNFHHVNDVGKLIELYHASNQYEILECKEKLFERFSSLELDRTIFGQILSLLGKL